MMPICYNLSPAKTAYPETVKNMSAKKKTVTKAPKVQLKDLKPKKDPKGGVIKTTPTGCPTSRPMGLN
jgi:hypothetical protein